MGKASNRKAERRKRAAEPTRAQQLRKTRRVDQPGRSVGTSIEEYEEVSSQGTQRLIQTLIARHTKRMDRIRLTPDRTMLPILDPLAPVMLLDIALFRHGASQTRHPAAYVGGWRDHLAWGVDSCVAAARLLLCGQVIGAAAVARTQFERWTFHRAAASGLTQNPGEDTVDYIARVWSAEDPFVAQSFDSDSEVDLPEAEKSFDEGEVLHAHIAKSDGEEICPPVLYEVLSELMHGRILPDAIAWDSTGLLAREDWPDDMWVAVGTIMDTITLCLRQLRLAAADLEEEAGREHGMATLLAMSDGFSEPDYDGTDELGQAIEDVIASRKSARDESSDGSISGGDPGFGRQPFRPREPDRRRSSSAVRFTGLAAPPFSSLVPLQPNEGLHPGYANEVVAEANLFVRVLAGERPAGRLYRDDELLRVGFSWHRARSIKAANMALSREKAMVGEDFNPDGLTGRGVGLVVVSEVASIAAGWLDRPEMSSAAYLSGSGLRSAYWLWLEDDDRAMSVLRCVLEQAARLRVWRLKPAKASALEEDALRTRPRDWLEAAGWKRLRALNAALGEFAHAKSSSNWSGARELLAQLQTDAEADTAIFTARGAALDFVAELVAGEVVAAVEPISHLVSGALSRGLTEVGIVVDRTNAEVDARFNHVWEQRTSRVRTSEVFARTGTTPATTQRRDPRTMHPLGIDRFER